MNREEEKKQQEIEVFIEFASKANIETTSIESGEHTKKQPDIICTLANGKEIGVELGRLTNPDLKAMINKWKPVNAEVISTEDCSEEITKKEIRPEVLISRYS